jgi:peroxiredoxin
VLRAELGRVVVLAFVPGLTDSAAAALVRALGSGADSLFVGDVAVVALAPVGVARLATVAREQGIRLKVLGDSAGTVRRLYGVNRGSIAVYVVDPLGRVSWRDLELKPFVSSSYKKIRDAVAKAGRGS